MKKYRMTITEVLPDGQYVVSSWGEEYVFDPTDARYYEIDSYKIEPGE